MIKPGLNRAIPMAFVGFAVGALFILILRSLQSMDPVWDAEVALVLTPFTVLVGFLWGMGAFDPRMNEHPHGPEDVHEGEEESAIVAADEAHAAHEVEDKPLAVLMSQIWQILMLATGAVVTIYIIAALPLGLYLQATDRPEASPVGIENNQTFLMPLGVGEFEASQLTVFLGFVAFTVVSVLLVAVVLWALTVGLHNNVVKVNEEEHTEFKLSAPSEQRSVPARVGTAIFDGLVWLAWLPVRITGRVSGWLARVLKDGLPVFFGQR